MLIGIKDFEDMPQSGLDDAIWKVRLVCTGSCIRSADNRMVWSVDSMYAPPADPHNARLVVSREAMLGSVLQAGVKSAYLQALLQHAVTCLKIPAWMLHLLPAVARRMKAPVARLLRTLHGHPRSGSDWYARFSTRLATNGWVPIPSEKNLWRS